jgi:hypothetical protein
MSDALFFNVKFDSLGNHKASGLEALGRLFDCILDAASKHPTVKPPKRRLVYVIRDFRDAADPHLPPGSGRTREDIEAQCVKLMNDEWSQRNEKKSEVRVDNATRLGGTDGVIGSVWRLLQSRDPLGHRPDLSDERIPT